MSIAKPFTFVANTFAKASEVNANFDTVYAQVNTNISAIATNATDIDNLENNKADINGSSSQRFAVADPVTNGDAVNKQTLMKAIGNSIDYINGLTISKDSGSPEDTIIVSPGSCYDSTKAVVLALDSATSKQNLNQGASATYYVYIIGNDTGSSIDILISQDSITPTLPSGYTKYRQIGKYTTDSDNHIQYIYNGTDTVPQTKATVIDYTKSADGVLKFSNGQMLQWGRYTSISSGVNTVTFNKPFGTASSIQVLGQTFINMDGSLYSPVIKSITTTNFKFYTTHANMDGFIWWAVGY